MSVANCSTLANCVCNVINSRDWGLECNLFFWLTRNLPMMLQSDGVMVIELDVVDCL